MNFKKLKNNPQSYIYPLLGFIALLFIIKFGKKLYDSLFQKDPEGKKEEAYNEQQQNLTDSAIEKNNELASQSSLTDRDAMSLADGLYEAMYFWGTAESKVLQILNKKTKADYAKIYKAFGLRSMWMLGKEYDLTFWIVDEFLDSTDEEKRLINKFATAWGWGITV